MLKYWLLGSVATGIAYVVTPWVAWLAPRIGAVAVPDQRRVHLGQIPSLGGLSLLLALLGALAVGALADGFVYGALARLSWAGGWLVAGLLVVTACGAADDVWTLGAPSKLCFQIVAGIMVLLAGYGISGVTNPFTGETIHLGWLGVPLTLLWVVGITNAFNLIDGLDGLAAGVALIAAGTLCLIAVGSGQAEVALVAIALAGALVGFLYYNFHPASVFLGDSGALLLGYVLAVLSMHAGQKGATAVVIASPILALGLPIADTALAMARRLLGALAVVRIDQERNEYRFLVLRSASILRADRDHIHHRLLALGLTHRRAVLLLYGVCFALSLLAFMAVRARGESLAVLVAVVAVVSWVGIRKLGYDEIAVLSRGTLLPLFDLPVLGRRVLHAVVDAGFVAAAYCSAVLVTHADELDIGARQHLLATLPLVVGVKLSVFVYTRLYRRAYRYTSSSDIVALGRSLTLAEATSLTAVSLLYGLPQPALASGLLDFYFCATLIVGTRISFKLLEGLARARAAAPGQRPVLIYGAGEGGNSALREILGNSRLGYRPLGFIDDREDLADRSVANLPVLGGMDAVEKIMQREGRLDVILTTDKLDGERLARLEELCQKHRAEIIRFRIVFEEEHASQRLAPEGRRAVG
jgi:UDP-GlcNAc:undecaprenyl-phosphate GlcNAc-1-phosphate transferase